MIYTPLTVKALKFAYDAHKNQTDKSGLPYIFHPYHLAEEMKNEATALAALLHDVVEDTDTTFEELEALGIGGDVIEALRLLMHDDSIPYMQYIERIKTNETARAVKRADLMHNSDLSRLPTVTQKDLERCRKYRVALAVLDEDRYDAAMGYYIKHIPLDDKKLCFFTVRYTEGGNVVSASFDIEMAEDAHFDLTGDNYRRFVNDISTNEEKSDFENIAELYDSLGESRFGKLLTTDYGAVFFQYHD